jgi:hypothetical protein
LKEVLAQKIPIEQQNVKNFRKEFGNVKIGEVTVDMVRSPANCGWKYFRYLSLSISYLHAEFPISHNRLTEACVGSRVWSRRLRCWTPMKGFGFVGTQFLNVKSSCPRGLEGRNLFPRDFSGS